MSTSTLSPLFELLDTPARTAARLAGESAFKSLGLALCGATLAALATLGGAALVTNADVLTSSPVRFGRGALAGIAIVLPSLMLYFTYIDAEVDAAALLGTTGTVLVVSGVVAMATLPLVTYFQLMDQTGAGRLIGFVPVGTASVTFLVMFTRVGRAFQVGAENKRLVDGAVLALAVAMFLGGHGGVG
ncbi:MAG: hypothetical protein RMA76_35845 [Deltaproteobacteria bacterium]|jgi:hypothetical protein